MKSVAGVVGLPGVFNPAPRYSHLGPPRTLVVVVVVIARGVVVRVFVVTQLCWLVAVCDMFVVVVVWLMILVVLFKLIPGRS